MKSFLKLEVVSKEDDMFQLEVTASNRQFCGTTKVYDGNDFLLKFAYSLIGFPKTSQSDLFYELGKKDGRSYFAMKFYAVDNIGHVAVQVTLEGHVPTKYRTEEKDKLMLEILTEPGLLDVFVQSLLALAKNQEGQALLEGVG